MKKIQKSKGFSLRWSLLGIVVSCWVLPMAVILGSLSYYTDQSARRRFDETVRASISSAASACRRNLREAVAASRDASYDKTIRNSYRSYLLNENRQLLYDAVTEFLRQNYRYDDNFLATMVFFHSEPLSVYYTFNSLLGAAYSNILEYQRDAHDEVMAAAQKLDTRIAFLNVDGSIYMVRNIVDADFKPFATIVSQINDEIMFGGFRSIMWGAGATLYINGMTVNAAPDLFGAQPIPIPEEYRLFPGEQEVSEAAGTIRVYGRESTDGVDLRYAVEVDMQSFLRGFFNFTDIVYLLLLFMIPLLLLAIRFFYTNIFKPMRGLISATGKIQEGSLGYQVGEAVGNREFRFLNEAFNGMSARLKQQFERIYSEEVALRDARIMALQSQINPHFLNNTLEIINWEVRLGNNANVSKLIEALSVMLDAAMDRKSLPLVTLSQEMMYVDSYLYIVSERFGKRLAVEKDIDPSLLRYEVPRLIMQPVIENAVEHGVGALQDGVIHITVKKEGGGMRLAIVNNSAMSKEDELTVARLLSPDYDAKSGGSYHLGIHNVNMRLKMIYGEDSGLSITTDGRNTTASFVIPLGD